MSATKPTPWFPLTNSPVREGVYQVLANGRIAYSRWSNGQWHMIDGSKDEAARDIKRSLSMYNGEGTRWRGLVKS